MATEISEREYNDQLRVIYLTCRDVDVEPIPRPSVMDALLHMQMCRRCRAHKEAYDRHLMVEAFPQTHPSHRLILQTGECIDCGERGEGLKARCRCVQVNF